MNLARVAAILEGFCSSRFFKGSLLLCVVALAAVLRFRALDVKSLWLDEIGQVLVAQHDGWDFLRGVAGHIGVEPYAGCSWWTGSLGIN